MRRLGLGLGLTNRRLSDGSNLDLDFRSMSELPSYMTFSRGTLGTCFDSAGVMRFCDHNLLIRSEEVNLWSSLSAVTVSANAANSPFGEATADKLIANSSGSGFYAEQSVAVLAATTYRGSVYLKAAEIGSAVSVLFGNSGLWGGLNPAVGVNLFTGTVTSTNNVVSASIESVGDGWHKVTIVAATSAAGTSSFRITPTNTTAGDGTSGIYVWGSQLTQGSYSYPYRATTSSAYYGPRFTHDPATLAPLGYLAEGQRTNWLLYTTLPGGTTPPTGWTNLVTTGTVAATSSIYGSADGAAAYQFTASATRVVYSQSFTTSNNTTYTFSVYCEAVSGTIQLQEVLSVTSLPAGCSITGWAIDGVAATSTSTTTKGRLSVTIGGTYTGASTVFRIGIGVGSNATGTVTLSRPQLEAASFPSSYIPTTTGAATRNADSLTITGTAATSRINNAEGTLWAQFRFQGAASTAGGTRASFYVDDGTYNEAYGIVQGSGSSGPGAQIIDGGSAQVNYQSASASAANAICKIALGYKLNDCAVSVNGESAVTDNTATMPTATRFVIGDRSAVGPLYGTIARVKYWPIRLTDAQLASITA